MPACAGGSSAIPVGQVTTSDASGRSWRLTTSTAALFFSLCRAGVVRSSFGAWPPFGAFARSSSRTAEHGDDGDDGDDGGDDSGTFGGGVPPLMTALSRSVTGSGPCGGSSSGDSRSSAWSAWSAWSGGGVVGVVGVVGALASSASCLRSACASAMARVCPQSMLADSARTYRRTRRASASGASLRPLRRAESPRCGVSLRRHRQDHAPGHERLPRRGANAVRGHRPVALELLVDGPGLAATRRSGRARRRAAPQTSTQHELRFVFVRAPCRARPPSPAPSSRARSSSSTSGRTSAALCPGFIVTTTSNCDDSGADCCATSTLCASRAS